MFPGYHIHSDLCISYFFPTVATIWFTLPRCYTSNSEDQASALEEMFPRYYMIVIFLVYSNQPHHYILPVAKGLKMTSPIKLLQSKSMSVCTFHASLIILLINSINVLK